MRQRVSRAIEEGADKRLEYREAVDSLLMRSPRGNGGCSQEHPWRAMVYRVSKPWEIEKDPVGDDRQHG